MLFDKIRAKASHSPQRIVLSEGEDPRIITAATQAVKTGLAEIILVGDATKIRTALDDYDADNTQKISIFDPKVAKRKPELVALYHDLRKHKGVTLEDAQKAVLNPHIFAALLVRAGYADGTLGGAVATTADIIRAAIQIIGVKPGTQLVSSSFLMIPPDDSQTPSLFADCALVIEPTAEELAQIAMDAADTYRALIGDTPRVAMLSFSTKGSANHPNVSRVADAAQIAKTQQPDLILDGEMQFDAAYVPEIAQIKAKDSPIEGRANVFVFPNLEAGNIGYKIAQRIGNVQAIGPIMQGLARPANDLSRGCNADDILKMIAVTACQAIDE